MIVMERVRNKNQHYDAWLHWNVSSQCNFGCDYCFGKTTPNASNIHSIDVEKLLHTLDKTEKTFRISFTGGEPFLIPNIIEACREITKQHYVSFNTNLVLNRVREFSNTVDPDRVLNVHASLHFEELLSKSLINKFVKHFQLLEHLGFNVYAEAVAHPRILAKVDEYKSIMQREKIPYTYAPFYGLYGDRTYPESYTTEEKELFGLTEEHIDAYAQKGNLCNAGFNAAVISPKGNISPCFQISESLGNIYSEFSFEQQSTICPAQKCGCPLNYYDTYLYKKI
jgi:MoaA/NifB/PqqE/SkfB family radical SAM enzyme